MLTVTADEFELLTATAERDSRKLATWVRLAAIWTAEGRKVKQKQAELTEGEVKLPLGFYVQQPKTESEEARKERIAKAKAYLDEHYPAS